MSEEVSVMERGLWVWVLCTMFVCRNEIPPVFQSCLLVELQACQVSEGLAELVTGPGRVSGRWFEQWFKHVETRAWLFLQERQGLNSCLLFTPFHHDYIFSF